jgi:hypothetical protein
MDDNPVFRPESYTQARSIDPEIINDARFPCDDLSVDTSLDHDDAAQRFPDFTVVPPADLCPKVSMIKRENIPCEIADVLFAIRNGDRRPTNAANAIPGTRACV